MDAISFVLGVQSSVLRSKELRDLIYRSGSDENGAEEADDADGNEGCYVMAVIEDSDEGNRERFFKRSILKSGSSEYRIDGRVVSFDQYKKVLAGMRLFVKSRNFLVFQGDVEAVASQTGLKLTKMFEEISGSEEFKQEYDQLKEEMEKAAENSAFTFNKKRGIQSEYKQCKEQKEEAERYESMEKEKASLLVKTTLLQMYKLQEERESLVQKMKEKRKELDEHKENKKVLEDEISNKKKEDGKEHKKYLQKEKQLKAKEEDLSKARRVVIDQEEQVSYSSKRLKELQDAKVKQEAKIAKLEADIVELQKESKQVENAKGKYEKELRKQLQNSEMSPEVKAEYDELKQVLYNETKDERAQLDELKLDEKKLEIEVAAKKREIEQINQRISFLENKEKIELLERKDELEAFIKKTMGLLQESGSQLKECETNLKKARQSEKEVEERLKNVYENLNNYKHEMKTSERKKRFLEAEESMKRLFGSENVFGRLVDLVRPRLKKHDLAIQTLMGKHLDSILVRDDKVAMECIEFLKQHRIPPMTFIPVNSIVVKPIQEKYRSLPGCKMAFDLLDFDEMYQSAVMYACGNAIVCDSLNVARDICYNKQQKVKAVTLDGTVIHKSGIISINPFANGQGEVSAISKWDSSDLEKHIKLKDRFENELQELSKEMNQLERQKKNLSEFVTSEDLKRKRAEDELAIVSSKITSIDDELNNSLRVVLEKELKALDELEGSKSFVVAAELHELIESKRALVYKDFMRKHKMKQLPNDDEAGVVNESNKRLLEFQNQIDLLHSQLQLLQGQLENHHEKIQKINDQLSTIDVDTCEKELETAKSDLKSILEEVEELKKELKNPKREAVLAEIKELKRAVHGCSKAMEECEKEIAIMEARTDRIKEDLTSSLKNCEMEEISVKHQQTEDGDVVIDFSLISGLLEEDEESLVELINKYETKLRQLINQMEAMAPNLKAIDKLTDVQTRLENTLKECDESRKDVKALRDRFLVVKTKRYELFMAAFNHISGKIDHIYKELTRSRSYPTGGTAYLTLESSEVI